MVAVGHTGIGGEEVLDATAAEIAFEKTVGIEEVRNDLAEAGEIL